MGGEALLEAGVEAVAVGGDLADGVWRLFEGEEGVGG